MNLNKLIHRGICLVLVAAVALSLAACAGNNSTTEPSTAVTTAPTEATNASTEGTTAPQAEGAIAYFSMNMNEDRYMNAYPENGKLHVDYLNGERKVGEVDISVLAELAAAVESSGVAALNGVEETTEGTETSADTDSASLYVEFDNGEVITAGYYGKISEEYIAAYNAMDEFFQKLTKDIPVYVPQPQVEGNVNPDALAAIQEILNGANVAAPDSLVISDIPKDDFFPTAAGLSSAEGIASATSCSSLMMTTPYSMVVVTLEDAGKAENISSDFETNLDWLKWICVQPSSAMIAYKDNMVLCLMGDSEMYEQTASAISQAGWNTFKTLTNPGAAG